MGGESAPEQAEQAAEITDIYREITGDTCGERVRMGMGVYYNNHNLRESESSEMRAEKNAETAQPNSVRHAV